MRRAVDTALESAIQIFYVDKDGFDPSTVPYLVKQRERVGSILVLLELVMHELHEPMKVTALFVFEGQALEKQIHEPGLAASDPAPDVEAARLRRRMELAAQER